jgi:hypothetical protein
LFNSLSLIKCGELDINLVYGIIVLLGEMYKIMKRNDRHLELYVKIGGRFKPVSKEVIDKQYK